MTCCVPLIDLPHRAYDVCGSCLCMYLCGVVGVFAGTRRNRLATTCYPSLWRVRGTGGYGSVNTVEATAGGAAAGLKLHMEYLVKAYSWMVKCSGFCWRSVYFPQLLATCATFRSWGVYKVVGGGEE